MEIPSLHFRKRYHVSVYGEVTPCDFTSLSFGNIRNLPLRDMWK